MGGKSLMLRGGAMATLAVALAAGGCATKTGKGQSPMKGRPAGKQEQSQTLVLAGIGVLVVLIALGLAYIVYALIAG